MSFDADDRPSRTSQPHTLTKIRYSRRTDMVDHHAGDWSVASSQLTGLGRLSAPHRSGDIIEATNRDQTTRQHRCHAATPYQPAGQQQRKISHPRST